MTVEAATFDGKVRLVGYCGEFGQAAKATFELCE